MTAAGSREGLVTLASTDSCVVRTGHSTVRCVLRGRLRRGRERVITGDRVRVSVEDDGTGVVEEILPRRSELTRPPIANVDHVVVMATVVDPALNTSLLDRLLVMVEHGEFDSTLCINKADLSDPAEVEIVSGRYLRAGYRVVVASALTGQGTDALRSRLKDRMSVLAGETGTGKSTMLNRLVPGADLQEGAVDSKIRRGRHTTRHVMILDLPGGGMVADSPGFMRVSLDGVSPRELADCFPEIRALAGGCRFADCLHVDEPGCTVKEAVVDGAVDGERYGSYLAFVSEAREWEDGLYR